MLARGHDVRPLDRRSRRRATPLIAVGVLVALAGSACGSDLSRDELRQAQVETIARTTGVRPSQPQEASAAVGTNPAEAAAAAPVAGAAVDSAAGPSGAAGGSGTTTTPSDGAAGSGGAAASATPAAGKTSVNAPGPAGRPAATPSTVGVPGSGGGSAATGPKSEIRIGVFGITSGPVGAALLPIPQGAKAWAADVNARGGLAGHPVRLVIGDDGGDPSRGLALAKQMVDQDKVLFFMSHYSVSTLQAVAPYLEQKKIPLIYSTPSNPAVDQSPMVFQPTTGALTGTSWMHIAPLLELTSYKKISIFYCRETPSCPALANGIEAIGTKAGVKTVDKQQISLAQPDYTSEVLVAKNAGAEALIAIAEQATMIRIMRSARRQGWNPPAITQVSAFEDRFLKTYGQEADGVLIGTHAAPWTSPLLADFRTAMDRYVPGGVKGGLSEGSWVAGKLLEKISAGFSPEPTATDVLNGLWGLKGETLGGLIPPISFARDTGHEATNQCVWTVKVEKGQFVIPNEHYVCAPGWKPVG